MCANGKENTVGRSRRDRRILFFLSALIFVLTFALYVQTRDFSFLNYDDDYYVTETAVTNGLTVANVKWAFTDATETTANFHPLTVLSLMTDVSLFGVHPGAMHLHNALLHALNAVLVFWLLLVLLRSTAQAAGTAGGEAAGRRLGGTSVCSSGQADACPSPDTTGSSRGTGSPGTFCAAVLAALLGALFWSLHPLRVESVAWVSSRKDVLSGFWYLLGTLVYLSYTRGRGIREALAVLVTLPFCLAALMSKPTAMVFPVTLFLADVLVLGKNAWRRAVGFGLIAFLFAVVTFLAQKEAMLTERLPLFVRLQNAAAAVGKYIATTLWPKGLSAFYPYEIPAPPVWFIFGIVLLVGLGGFAVSQFWRSFLRNARENVGSAPEGLDKVKALAAFGILWFFAALVPVIGIIRFGEAARADRFTYLPGIGISILLAAGLSACAVRFPRPGLNVLLPVCAVAGLALGAFRYIGVWRDPVTLFMHARQAVPENHVAECNLGAECFRKNDVVGAINHFSTMVAQRGCDHASVTRLEYVLWKSVQDEHPDIKTPQDILQLNVRPDDPLAAVKNFALACIAYDRQLYLAAEGSVLESLRLNPDAGYAREVYARILLAQERYDEALEQARAAQTRLPKRTAVKRLLKQIRRVCTQP